MTGESPFDVPSLQYIPIWLAEVKVALLERVTGAKGTS